MAKTEALSQTRHTLVLENRERMDLGGVQEVSAFSDTAVSLKTSCGALLIQGRGLNISRLNTDTGELHISGEVTMLKYSKEKRRRSLLEGLFK